MKKSTHHSFENRLRMVYDKIYVPADLPKDTSDIIVVDDSTCLRECDLLLERYYSHRNYEGSNKKYEHDVILNDASNTSHAIPSNGIRTYNVSDKAPRFVIWNGDDDLSVCSTAVYRCSDTAMLPIAIIEAINWATRRYMHISKILHVSVIVFDLDQTLITNSGDDFLENYECVLNCAREKFHYVILWSHGDSLHVDTYVSRMNFKFDLVLSKDKNNSQSCKNILYLYNYFGPEIRILYAVLVDDSPYNWSPEYNAMVVPIRGIRDIKSIALAVERVRSNQEYLHT